MATGMKRWLAIATVALGAVALWALPPSGLELRERDTSEEEERYRDLQRDVRRANAALQRLQWSDSFAAITVAQGFEGIAVRTRPIDDDRWEEDVRLRTEEGLREFEQDFAAMQASIERRRRDVAVGLFEVGMFDKGVQDMPTFRSDQRETYVGERDHTPYCFELEPNWGIPTDYELRQITRSGLEGCRLYATYGLPGDRVAEWMQDGGLAYAQLRELGDRNERWYRTYTVPAIFGLNKTRFVRANLAVSRCFGGFVQACVDVVLGAPGTDDRDDPDDVALARLSPLTYMRGFGRQSAFGRAGEFLLFDLETEFGPERFERFWRSDAPVPEAFEAAFGAAMGEWLHGWVDREIGTFKAGPGVGGSAWWLSILAIGLLGMVAAGTAWRRRVG